MKNKGRLLLLCLFLQGCMPSGPCTMRGAFSAGFQQGKINLFNKAPDYRALCGGAVDITAMNDAYRRGLESGFDAHKMALGGQQLNPHLAALQSLMRNMP